MLGFSHQRVSLAETRMQRNLDSEWYESVKPIFSRRTPWLIGQADVSQAP